MACPFTACSLQARAELLACVSSVYAVLRDQLASEDVRLFVRWLERFSRYPVGLDDSSTIHFSSIGAAKAWGEGLSVVDHGARVLPALSWLGSPAAATASSCRFRRPRRACAPQALSRCMPGAPLPAGPIQKSALAGLAALPPLPPSAAEVWPEALGVLCNMLRPFTTLPLRQYAQQLAALQVGWTGRVSLLLCPTFRPHARQLSPRGALHRVLPGLFGSHPHKRYQNVASSCVHRGAACRQKTHRRAALASPR
jgi:hypothetical protein